MKTLGNILWFFLAGLWLGLGWCIAGIFWCITLVGIPWGVQCFKFSKLAFFPFGKEVEYGGGGVSLLLNIIWILCTGCELAISSLIIGALLCVTIVGIPFGKQCFKLAKLAVMPFGTLVRSQSELR